MPTKASIVNRMEMFGLPHIVRIAWGEESKSKGTIERCFIGEGDGVVALAVFKHPDNAGLRFILTRGTARPNIAARCDKMGVVPSSIRALRLREISGKSNGVTVEGIGGRIEQDDADIAAAMVRECEEELGVGEDSQGVFGLGQPSYPDVLCSIEKWFCGVVAVKGVDVNALQPPGDRSAAEARLVPFSVSLGELVWLQRNGFMPVNYVLLLALRLKAMLPDMDLGPSRCAISMNAPRGVRFDGIIDDHRLESSDGDGLIVQRYNCSVEVDRKGWVPFDVPALISFPVRSLDIVSLFVTYTDTRGERRVVLPAPQEEPIYYCRGLWENRLRGRKVMVDGVKEKPLFATGINVPIPNDEVIEINQGRSSVEEFSRRRLRELIGTKAAAASTFRRILGPAFLTPAISTRVTYSYVVEVASPLEIHLASGYRVVAIEQAFGELATGQLADMTWETMALWYLISQDIYVPKYIASFPAKEFLEQL